MQRFTPPGLRFAQATPLVNAGGKALFNSSLNSNLLLLSFPFVAFPFGLAKAQVVGGQSSAVPGLA